MSLEVSFGRRRSSHACALLLACFLSVTACTTAVTAPAASDASEPPSTLDAGTDSPSDPTREACDAEGARLQEGLDRAHSAKTDAVLAVKTTSCGLRVLTSGPSKLDGSELHKIGSVTKTYVAAVILRLAKGGALALDDRISTWVKDVPGGDTITIRQLLDHTSGLFNYTDDEAFMTTAFAGERSWSPRELLEVAVSHDPYFEPGAGWHYSNTNYVLLGMIAEASGKAKIGVLVRQHVLDAIEARATFFDGEEPVRGTLATGRNTRGQDISRAIGPSWAWAAGAMVATPADLARWVEQLGSGAFHGAQQAELLDGVATDVSTIRYGLGIMIFDARATGGAGIGYGHGGDIPGYHTQTFYFPETKTTLVSIVDSDAESPNDVSVAALDVLFPPSK